MRTLNLVGSILLSRAGTCTNHVHQHIGQHWLPRDGHFDDDAMSKLAAETLDNESLVAKNDYLKDALLMREYAAYAALIFMVLPSLRALNIADFNCATLDHLHTALRNLIPGPHWNSRHPSDGLKQRLSLVNSVSFNVDMLSGVAYPRHMTRFNLDPLLNLPCVHNLELSVPDGSERQFPTRIGLVFNDRNIGANPTNITRLVVRHSEPALRSLQQLLSATVQLETFTYDFFYDRKERADVPPRWLDLGAWTDSLPRSLKTLVLSVENCDTGAFPFEQPRIGEKLFGYLDLTRHENLHTVEVPFPFLTGDPDFSINNEIYPLLPPNLRHLSLRTDMSQAQHQFSFDTARLPKAFTFQESEDEARHSIHARMDVSYMFHAAMVLLDFADNLETVSVWQPADASLVWFDGQIKDFAQTCRNKSIRGLIINPMILRWHNAAHWNLAKEITVYDPARPSSQYHETLCRGERAGIPLGLASQYHMHALRRHLLKLR
jgi:hypothetical protein